MGAHHVLRQTPIALASLALLNGLLALVSLALLAPTGVGAAQGDRPAGSAPGCVAGQTEPRRVGSLIWDTSLVVLGGYIRAQRETAACLGLELDIRDGGGDATGHGEVIERFIDEGTDLIIVTTIEKEGVVPALRLANDAGVPVIVALIRIGGGADVVTFVGHDDRDIGRVQGEMLAAELGGTGRVGLVVGAPWHAMVEEGLRESLERHPGIDVVEATWSGEDAELPAITESWLDRYPPGELGAILVQGAGVVDAARLAQARGRDDVRFFAGVHDEVVDDAIADGTLAGAVSADPGEVGAAAVEDAWRWLSGLADEVPRPEHHLDPAIVTRANVDEHPVWVAEPTPTPLPIESPGSPSQDPPPDRTPIDPDAFERIAHRLCLRGRPDGLYRVRGRPSAPRTARDLETAHLVLVEYRDLRGTRRREPRLIVDSVYDLGTTPPFAWTSTAEIDVLACVALRATRRETWQTVGTAILHTIDAADAIVWMVDADDGRRIGRPWLRRPPTVDSGRNRILFGDGGPGIRPPVAADIVADVVAFLGR